MANALRALDWDEFDAAAEAYDRAVEKVHGIDRFCSSSAWVLSARAAFMPAARPAVFRSGDCFVALATQYSPAWGWLWTPLEAGWLLSCPLAGQDPGATTLLLLEALARGEPRWDSVLISGIAEDASLWRRLLAALGTRCALYRVEPTARRIASLAGGVDGFLSRRGAKFRANLKRDLRACDRAGIAWRRYDQALSAQTGRALFEGAMAIEARSWKGLSGQGVDAGQMRDFYRNIMDRLGPVGGARLLIAERDGQDVGYVFGGVRGDYYRGFQFSYDDRHRALGLGNALQFRMIEMMCAEGVRWFDLGVASSYKTRWAEIEKRTAAFLASRQI